MKPELHDSRFAVLGFKKKNTTKLNAFPFGFTSSTRIPFKVDDIYSTPDRPKPFPRESLQIKASCFVI